MKQRLPKFICLLLLPVLLLTGCWSEELPEEEDFLPSGDLISETPSSNVILPEHLSLPYAPELTLDPLFCPDGMQQVVSSLLCEGLFRVGPDLEPTPWLCESYTYAPDTFTYVFTLRNGVRFSDGSALTGNDVKSALNRAKSSERYGSRLTQVASISADDRTVTVTLSSANSGFPALLDVPISKAGPEGTPVGTGPYLFTVENSAAWLIANQTWWCGIKQPVSRIALVEASDQDTMLYRFTSHDVQLVTADLAGTDPISATGSIVYRDVNTTILQYIGCNTTREPLNDPIFRRILSQGIDRTNLVSAFLSGHGLAAQFPVSPAAALYPQDLEIPYSHSDFATALASGEYALDRTLTLLVNQENTFKLSAAQEIAKNLTAAGVPVTVRSLPWAEYTAALSAGNFDLYYGEVKLTADWDLSPLLGTGGSLNYGGWTDPVTDQLLDTYASSADRSAAMKRLCIHLQNQAPILPLCFKSTSVLLQSDVFENLTSTMSDPFYNLTECVVHLKHP